MRDNLQEGMVVIKQIRSQVIGLELWHVARRLCLLNYSTKLPSDFGSNMRGYTEVTLGAQPASASKEVAIKNGVKMEDPDPD